MDTLASEAYLSLSRGGTGIGTTNPANGSILIGNGTGYSLATITAGTGIGITNAAGSITINSTVVDTNTTYTAGNGLTLASTTFKLGGEITEATRLYDATHELMYIKTDGNIGIGNTNPQYKLDVTGTVGFSSTIHAPNVGTGVDNSVLVLNSSGDFVTDEIDSRVWGSSLTDYTGTPTTGYVTYWSDLDTLASEAYLSLSRGGTGIGTTNPANGSILIGNGTGYSLATITAGTGIGITNAAGSITINSTVVDTNTTYTAGNGLTLASTTFKLGGEITEATRLYDATHELMYIKTDGNIGIGNTNPQYKLDVTGTVGFSSTIHAPNVGTGVDNSVLVLNSSGDFVTDEIDSRVWGSSLTDYTGTPTTGYVTYWSDLDTLASEAYLSLSRGGTGIGTTNPANGSILIGNGTGYSLATITAGTGIGITNAAGSITINSTVVDTNTTYTAGNGLTLASTTFKLGGEITEATRLYDATHELMYIKTDGNIGIGNTNPQYKLDVTGTVGFSSTIHAPNVGTGVDNSVLVLNSSGDFVTDEIDSRVWGSSLTDYTGTPTTGYVTYWSDLDTLASEAYLSLSRGGTGIGTTNPANGSILIGNGTGYSLATITAGTGIGITNAAGSITINSTVVDTNTTYTAGNGLTLASTTFKLGGEITEATRLYDATHELMYIKTDGNIGIGNTNPQYKLDVTGTVGFSSTIHAPNVGTGVDNSVLVLNSSGDFVTDEIDSRVWGSSLTDYTGTPTTGYVTYWSDLDTLASEAYLSLSRGGTGIGTTNPANGSILIGNGTGYSLATITAGTGIGITNAAGSITINSTVVDTNTTYTAGNGLTLASTTFKLGGEITEATRLYDATHELMYIKTDGNIGIGNTNPQYKLDVTGTVGFSSTIHAPNVGTGVDNSVLVLNSSGDFVTDEIDSRVWGSSLTDYTGTPTTGYVTYWSDLDTLASEAYLSLSRGGTGIGTTNPANGSILIGNGTGYSLATITAGTGIGITNAAGSITINSTVVDTNTTYTAGNGLTLASTTFKLGGEITEATRLYDATHELMYIKTDGNIGIGTTDPGSYKLSVNGSLNTTSLYLGGSQVTSTAAELNYLDGTTATAGGITFGNGTYLTNDSANLFWDDSLNRLGIGTTSPTSTLSVGATSQFQVDSSGNIVKINNVTTSFPSGQGAANSMLRNDGSGNLTWADPAGTGTMGYWQRNGTTLSQTNITDNLSIGSTAPASAMFYAPGSTNNNAWFNLGTGNLGIGTTVPSALLHLSSTSTSTSFQGFNLDWQPGSATTLTGDLFKINVGQYGNVGNIFALYDNGTEIFSVDQSKITNSLPTEFTSAGDVSMAYDLIFTNQNASNIKTNASFTIDTGESWESNNITLRTYNAGNIILESANLWVDGTNVGIGTTAPAALLSVGSSSQLVVNASGYLGIGTTDPNDYAEIGGGVTIGSGYLGSNTAPANGLLVQGNVGIGTTSPITKLHVLTTGSGDITASFVNSAGGAFGAGMVGYTDDGAATGTGDRLGYFALGGAVDTAHTLVRPVTY